MPTNLKNLLLHKNISLNQLAKKTSINKSTLHNYLNGVDPQGLHALLKLAEFFEITIEELLFDKETKITNPRESFFRVGEGHFEIIIKQRK